MLRLGAIANELSPSTERAFTLAQEWGLSEIELHTVWEKNIEMLNDEEIGRLKDLLHKHQLHLCCLSSTVFLRCHLDDRDEPIEWHTSFRSINGHYAEHLHALERCLAIATVLEAPLVRIFGFWRTGPTLEETFQEAAERIRPGIRMAEAAGIPLALENCPHTYFDWGRRAARLLEIVDSPWLQLLWDPCNALRSDEPDYLEAYGVVRQRLAHVHAKDVRIDPDLDQGRVYTPIGQGQVEWREILDCLERDHYEGVVSLEPHHVGPDGTLETSAAASFEGLEGMNNLLRSTPEINEG